VYTLSPDEITSLALLHRFSVMSSEPSYYPPNLTCQYSAMGELDTSAPCGSTPFTPDARAEFKRSFFERWSRVGDPEPLWERLRFLLQEQLDRLPDNPFVQRDAWTVGIGDGGPDVRRWTIRYYMWVGELIEAEAVDQRRRVRRLELIASVAVVFTRQTDNHALAHVRMRDTGECLEFVCRNVFDVGYVVNPAYALQPGMKPGGILDGDTWMSFSKEQGWSTVRSVTASEKIAMEYLREFPPVNSNVRM
jgi:hypothetical protein